jgi:aspartate carbamoyltransferase catalytic subunit
MAQLQENTQMQSELLRENIGINTPVKTVTAAQQQALLLHPAPLQRNLYPTKSCVRQPHLMQR